MRKGATGTATVHIDATPQQVYDLVTDVRRMGEWSPETYKAEWLDGATGPAVGARFRGTNRRGIFRWSTRPRVVVADAGREFTFVTELRGKELTKWTYVFEPDGEGTKLTERFELLRDTSAAINFADKYLLRIEDRTADLVSGMQATLERIKAAAEQPAS